MNHIEVNAIANACAHAAAVTLRLAEEGIEVRAAMANGRRPVLFVDRLPKGMLGAVKRSHPNGYGGVTVVKAADYHGCQLEWMYDAPSASAARERTQEVGHA